MFNRKSQEDLEIEREILDIINSLFLDIINIRQILIIHNRTGTTIVSKSFLEAETDPDLISGFLTAISAFESELTGSMGGLEELKYKNIRILIDVGELISACLIMEGHHIPSDKLRNKFKSFRTVFERKFHSLLEDFEGYIAPFRNINDILEEHFEISLLEPKLLLNQELYKYLYEMENLSDTQIADIKLLGPSQFEVALGRILKSYHEKKS
ncbi:MAG: hypothetical protein ACTSRW_06785 [Candidatus Helarchaeota archaeon]